MIHNSADFSGPCTCGSTHAMTTQFAILEANCMRDFDTHMQSLGVTGSRAVVYDRNTYHAKGLLRPAADQEIILQAEGLRADEKSVSQVLKALDADTRVLIAIGGGTLHDIVRYCAEKLGIPYVACPTAASTGSFCACDCHMILEGKPTIVPAHGPIVVLADSEVLRQAPSRLTAAGMGEILSKAIVLADMRITGLITGNMPCAKTEAMVRQGILLAIGCLEEVVQGNGGAFTQMAYGLFLSSLSAQMSADTAKPLTAPEQLAALMDLMPKAYGAKEDMHSGEILGVWAILLADLYHQNVQNDLTAACLMRYQPLSEDFLASRFGCYAQGVAAQNAKDCLASIPPELLIDKWREIQLAVADIPSGEKMATWLGSLGAPTSPEDIGLSATVVPEMLKAAPCLANEPTLLRLQRLLNLRYAKSAEASRAPFRNRRYADKAMIRAGNSNAVSASSIK